MQKCTDRKWRVICSMQMYGWCVMQVVQWRSGRKNNNSLHSIYTSGCPWPKATVKSPVGAPDLRPLWSFIFSYLLLFIWPLPCPPCPSLPALPPCPAVSPCPALSDRPAPAPAIENVARRHRCPIISEETTNDGGFFGFTTYLLLPFGKVTR
jgi:hypothetical protein